MNKYSVVNNKDEAKIILTLIRHGLTMANEEKRFIGKTDEPLSEAGRALIESKKVGYPPADIVFVSPLIRCIETAQIIYEGRTFIEIPEFEEIDFGEFEMKSHLELDGNAGYQAWIDSCGRGRIPGGESQTLFTDRVMRGFEKCLRAMDDKACCAGGDSSAKDCVIRASAVVHGGTIMALRSRLCGEEYFDCMIANGDCYQIYLG